MTTINTSAAAFYGLTATTSATSNATSQVAQNTQAGNAQPTSTISRSNSTEVVISATAAGAAAVVPTKTIADAITAYDADKGDPKTPIDIKDTSANFLASFKASQTKLEEMADKGGIKTLAFSDAKLAVLTFARADVQGDPSDTANPDTTVKLLQKITSSFVLNVTDVDAKDAANVKAISKTSSITMTVKSAAQDVANNLGSLQTLAKGKVLTAMTLVADGNNKPLLTLTADAFTKSPDALSKLQGNFGLTITDAPAATALTALAAADKVLSTASKTNGKSNIDIKDTAANLVAKLKDLETLSAAGRIGTITVSDGKALVLTSAQIASSSHVLAEEFSASISVEATGVAVADLTGLEDKIEKNTKLTLAKVTVSDKAANIQTGLDKLEATAVAGTATGSAAGHFALANIAVFDKGTLTLTNSKMKASIDALATLSGAYTLKVTDITAEQAAGLKTPAKDVTLSLAISDITSGLVANIDKLATLVKNKAIASISLNDMASKALTLTSSQLASNSGALALVQGNYKLNVTDVTAADLSKVLATKNLTTVAVKDSLANLIKNSSAIQTSLAAGKAKNIGMTVSSSEASLKFDLTGIATTATFNLMGGVTADSSKIWGNYSDSSGQSHAFVTKLDGSGYTNLEPAGAKSSTIKGLTADGSKAWGTFIKSDGTVDSYTIKLDGTGMVDLAPTGSKETIIGGVTPDGTKTFGTYKDQAGKHHAFISGIDGKGLKDITPSTAIDVSLSAVTPDGTRVFGAFQKQDKTWESFSTKIDGSDYKNIAMSGANSTGITGFSPDSTKAYGGYIDPSFITHAFVSKLDGTGMVPVSLSSSASSTIDGMTKDGALLWGHETDGSGNKRIFTAKSDGSNIKELKITNAVSAEINGLTVDGTKVVGRYRDQSSQYHAFVANLDGTGFTDLTPSGGTNVMVTGLTPDSTKLWGRYTGPDKKMHAFSIGLDGTGFKDLLPADALSSLATGVTSDGKVFGSYQSADKHWHGFLTQA